MKPLHSISFSRTSLSLLAGCFLWSSPLIAQGWIWDDNGLTTWFESVSFVDSSRGWIAGYDGTILYTTSGGSHWSRQESGTSSWLTSIYFKDSDYGWAVGFDGTILHTMDGGRNWVQQSSGTTQSLTSIMFTDRANGWVVGRENTILHTTDGGNMWLAQSSGSTNVAEIHDVFFMDANNGWAVGDGHGVVFHTTNGGTDWLPQSHGADGELLSVYFSTATNGWAVGWNGNVLHTTDGGNTWSLQIVGQMTEPFLSVCFPDENNGWIVGSLGVIHHTTNGGQDWVQQFDPAGSRHLSSVSFSDRGHGWAVGSRGTILRTTSGGDGLPRPNRISLMSPLNRSTADADTVQFVWSQGLPEIDGYWLEYARDSLFTNPAIDSTIVGTSKTVYGLPRNNTVWWRVRAHNASGWGSFSNTWRFSTLLTSAGEAGLVPGSHVLEQNYPNPFNPTTMIHYGLSGNVHVSLKVYNMLGQLITTLVDQNQLAGSHEAVWNGSNNLGQKVAGGIYVYQLKIRQIDGGQVGDFTATKRMLLLK